MGYVENVTPQTSSSAASAPMSLPRDVQIREITDAEHHQFLAGQVSASFLQNPRWPRVKTDWRGQSIGWFHRDQLVAASLVLHRHLPLPVLKKRSLAYLADGPVFDASQVSLGSLLTPLIPFLRKQGAFLVRMGLPAVLHRWEAATIRRTLAAGEGGLISDLEPAETYAHTAHFAEVLREQGWVQPDVEEDFTAGQPQFQARIPLPELTAEDRALESAAFQEAVEATLKRMDSTSRRQTRKAFRSDLTFSVGTAEDLPAWHQLYSETAQRDDFTGRPLSYFQRMYAELNDSPSSSCELLLAHWEGTLLAAAIYVQQNDFGWYVYGASSSQERNRYAPRGLQLEQIRHSLLAGARWYDLGGVSATLDPQHPLAGLTRFKTTMGSDVVQTLGEWDFPISKTLTKAFNMYMARR